MKWCFASMKWCFAPMKWCFTPMKLRAWRANVKFICDGLSQAKQLSICRRRRQLHNEVVLRINEVVLCTNEVVFHTNKVARVARKC